MNHSFPLTHAALEWARVNPELGGCALIAMLAVLAFALGDIPIVRKIVRTIMD